MTMILNIASPEFVAQVSDRRLTSVANGKISLHDDNANKQTVFCNQMTFAYTGLANIEGKRTDIWLSETIAPYSNLEDAKNAIKDKATEAFSRMKQLSPEIKRHAFVSVGWTRSSGSRVVRGIKYRISNCHDDSGKVVPRARSKFHVGEIICEPDKYGVVETGNRMNQPEMLKLKCEIDRLAVNLQPGPVLRLFVEAIRAVAERDATVGRNLLAVVIPKAAAFAENTTMLGSPRGTVGTSSSIALNDLRHLPGVIRSVYYPEGSCKSVEYFPNFAGNGISTTDLKGTFG